VLVTVFVLGPAAEGALGLPDGRGWEMVSPVDKNGGDVQGFGVDGNVLQAASSGEAVSFSSAASFGEGAEAAPALSQYLAGRGPGGWGTRNLTVPQLSSGYGEGSGANPYKLFSPGLAAALLSNGQRCRGSAGQCAVANPPLAGSGAPVGYRNYYLWNETGEYQALLTAANAPSLTLEPEDFELTFVGASPDLAHVVLSTCAALTPPATEVPAVEGCDPGAANLYEWTAGSLRLLNLLPGQAQGSPGASLAAPSGAISTDGVRVYFTQAGDLYLREGNLSKQVDEDAGGGGAFQIAAADGGIAFFIRAGHLYRYEAATEATTDLTPGGEVEGVLGAAEDGSSVYYLTSAGLFRWHLGSSEKIAAAAAPSDYPPATGTARVSADGAQLAFLSRAPLTGYDNSNQASGEPDSEVFLYDATANGGAGALTCASCNPSGKRPLGPATIPGAIAGEGTDAVPAYKPRVLSVGGRRLFFDSRDALVLRDTNKDRDVYQWEAQGQGSCQRVEGCVELISSGRSGEGASFADASADGSDVFFLTDGSLVGSDPGSVDLYDAREGGGFPEPAKPIPCDGDDCQSLPSPPEDPTPGTLAVEAGNPPPHFGKAPNRNPKRRKHHKKRREHRHRHHGRGIRR
jgi:hypothetical protein